MKTLRSLSRIIVGSVFIFSGFVKAVDPLGSTYKFTDYFNAFGMSFFSSLSLPIAILLPAAELVLGISLLLGYRMKIVSWLLLLFMLFFTVLTFVLAIFNPVTDCGCFGDALILSNWQTFWKNIILMVFTLLIFSGKHLYPEIMGKVKEWSILGLFFIMVTSLSIYCKNHLPVLDFMPYKTGTNIPAASEVPAQAQGDVWETHLYYQDNSNGKISEFGIGDFPRDSTWKFIRSKSVLIKEGYKPPIHDFSISFPNGEDLTEKIKKTKGFVFLLVSYNINKADKNALVKAGDYYKLSGLFKDVGFYAVTSSVDDDVRKTMDSLKLGYDFGKADEIALKTMIRSNPGLLLIKNGTILGKWHYNDFPDITESGNGIAELLRNYPMSIGIDLQKLRTAPDGARNDIFKTSLVYKYLATDSLATFSMESFPKGNDWEFVSSNSEVVQSGFISALKDFKMKTLTGEEMSEKIIQEQGDVFLISAKEPHNLDPDILERLNKLSVIAASFPGGPVFFYAITGLTPDQLFGFADSFISPITFCSGPPGFVESVSGNGVSLFHIKNGVITGRWDNASIPEPGKFREIISSSTENNVFEPIIMPYLIKHSTNSIEQKRIYIFILGFLFLTVFIRVFLEEPNKRIK